MKQTRLASLLLLMVIALVFTRCNDNNNGPADGQIPFDEKRALRSIIRIDTARLYQRNFLSGRDSVGGQNFKIPNAEFFTRDAIIVLLNQKGADGIRIYYGRDDTGGVRLVLLPVDQNGRDIKTTLIDRGVTKALSIPGIPSAQARITSEQQAVENGQTCPPCIID